MDIQVEQVASKIEAFIAEKVTEFARDGAILGMSGGIDSTVTAILAVRALGAEKVLALLLPERDSSRESRTDALTVIKDLKIAYRTVNLTPLLSALGIYHLNPLRILGRWTFREKVVKAEYQRQAEILQETPFRAGLQGTRHIGKTKAVIDAGNAYARAKHRARMLALYFFADLENRLVLGTTNKSEAMTGFVVKWGDNVADIEPLLPLYKTQVRQLALYLGVPHEIMDKPPSPDLIPGIVDELALGIDYETLDKILWGLEQGWEKAQLMSTYRVEGDAVEHVRELVRRSKHLRELPPAPLISTPPGENLPQTGS